MIKIKISEITGMSIIYNIHMRYIFRKYDLHEILRINSSTIITKKFFKKKYIVLQDINDYQLEILNNTIISNKFKSLEVLEIYNSQIK